jgi:FixJ family two-component response regulator
MANGTSIFSDAEWSEIFTDLSLSKREAQIVKELFSDNSDKRIAMDLQISLQLSARTSADYSESSMPIAEWM